jgi:hypothetical protein
MCFKIEFVSQFFLFFMLQSADIKDLDLDLDLELGILNEEAETWVGKVAKKCWWKWKKMKTRNRNTFTSLSSPRNIKLPSIQSHAKGLTDTTEINIQSS